MVLGLVVDSATAKCNSAEAKLCLELCLDSISADMAATNRHLNSLSTNLRAEVLAIVDTHIITAIDTHLIASTRTWMVQ